MKVIVHIGPRKTGTSSIQNFLSTNRGALQKSGVHYSTLAGRTGAQTALLLYTLDDGRSTLSNRRILLGLRHRDYRDLAHFRASFREDLRKEFQDSGAHTAIVSCEGFEEVTSTAPILRLLELLDGIASDYSILTYLRPPADAFCSAYGQIIRVGSSLSIDTALERADFYAFDPESMLRPWVEVFGNQKIVVRPFHRGFLENDDVVTDFRQVVGLTASQLERTHDVNFSPDAASIEFLRMLNESLASDPESESETHRAFRTQLISRLAQVFGNEAKLRLSRWEAESFTQRFRPAYENVMSHYWGGPVGDYFDVSHYADQRVGGSITLAEFAARCALLWSFAEERHGDLMTKLRNCHDRSSRLRGTVARLRGEG